MTASRTRGVSRGGTQGATARKHSSVSAQYPLWVLPWAVVGVAAISLACDQQAPKKQQPSEPWPAQGASKAAKVEPRELRRDYVLAGGQKLGFELKTQAATITGEFPVLKGVLSVDLMNLKHTDGKLEIDLGATRVTSGSEKELLERSMIAQNWLNVGGSVPEANRDSLRWASFLIEEVAEARATAPHEAPVNREVTSQAQAPPAASIPSVASAAADAPTPAPTLAPELGMNGEVRSTRARVLGSLQLNQRRVTEPHEVTLDFYYPASATPGVAPERIVVKSLGSVGVPLNRHAIEPRDSAGVSIAADLKLLGKEVGTVARVSFVLAFLPKDAQKTSQP